LNELEGEVIYNVGGIVEVVDVVLFRSERGRNSEKVSESRIIEVECNTVVVITVALLRQHALTLTKLINPIGPTDPASRNTLAATSSEMEESRLLSMGKYSVKTT
jgi:hypothetical protein